MYISAIIIILSLIFSILTFNFAYFIISAIILLLLPIIRYLRDNQYKEFEYIFTNGNLQIDIIYNKKRRKTIIDKEIREFETYGKINDIKLDNKTNKIYCIPWDNKNDVYVLITNENPKKALYIAPDSEMHKLINIHFTFG